MQTARHFLASIKVPQALLHGGCLERLASFRGPTEHRKATHIRRSYERGILISMFEIIELSVVPPVRKRLTDTG